MRQRGRKPGGGGEKPPGGLHSSEREARLLQIIRGAEDPEAVMDEVLKTIFALLPQSPQPDSQAPAAQASEGGTTE